MELWITVLDNGIGKRLAIDIYRAFCVKGKSISISPRGPAMSWMVTLDCRNEISVPFIDCLRCDNLVLAD